MERANGMSLEKLVGLKPLRTEEIKHVMSQALDALVYMHAERVCHRDLKPDNIIVNPMDNSLKIIDFNVSAQYEKGASGYTDTIQGGTGLKEWSAPETRTSLTYSAKCDSWSMGLILSFMLLRKMPNKAKASIDARDEISEQLEKKPDCCPQLLALFKGLTIKEAGLRWSPQ